MHTNWAVNSATKNYAVSIYPQLCCTIICGKKSEYGTICAFWWAQTNVLMNFSCRPPQSRRLIAVSLSAISGTLCLLHFLMESLFTGKRERDASIKVSTRVARKQEAVPPKWTRSNCHAAQGGNDIQPDASFLKVSILPLPSTAFKLQRNGDVATKTPATVSLNF